VSATSFPLRTGATGLRMGEEPAERHGHDEVLDRFGCPLTSRQIAEAYSVVLGERRAREREEPARRESTFVK
jgi:hypothetical protein